jgi:hypothetical protein
MEQLSPQVSRLGWSRLLTPGSCFGGWHSDFDAAEMSFSTYANLVSRGDDRYIAVPFFPSRAFRHGDIYVHRDSSISQPADLREKKVGIPSIR